MSETSSESPSIQIHPISPSSSLSSALSEPHSEPTSDEEPDLGAFNAVLREWTHLQPPPRIPVQIRSATSSTTPTFQPSLAGSEIRSERSRLSVVSSFTRPPSSSAQPEGSTVWAQAPIASYLYSGTPSNDNDDEEGSPGSQGGGVGEYTPNSMASTSLTVEIESEPEFNGRIESSPYPFPSESGVSGVSVPVPLEVETTRVDSREMENLEESSATSIDRTFTVTTIRSLGETGESQLTSVQLRSQVRPTPSTSSGQAALSISSSSTNTSDSPPGFPHSRSRNPIPPRTVSDSSVTTSGSASSSNLSLISYQISEAPSMPLVEDSSSTNASADSGSVESPSVSMGLKTQRSMPTTVSSSMVSLGTQRPQQQCRAQVTSDTSTTSNGSPLPNPYSSIASGSPLPNPYSPLPFTSSQPPVTHHNTRRPMLSSVRRQDMVVDDLGTPDQPPSETLLFDPPRERKQHFQPIIDDDEEDIQVERIPIHARKGSIEFHSGPSGYASGYGRPGPSTLAQETTYIQTFSHFQRSDRHELHVEDEVDFDDDEDRYRSRYSHGPTPRSFGPALTPKGIPTSSTDLRSQGPAQPTTTTMTNSLVHPFGYSNQSLLNTSNHESQAHQQLFSTQHSSLVQSQLQYETNEPYPNVYPTAAPSIPQSMHQQSLSSTFPYAPHAPIATQSSSTYISQPHAYSSSSSQYSYSSNQTQDQMESARNPHGYPYSLLGLHGLPGQVVASEEEPSPPSSSSLPATTTISQINPREQAPLQAASLTDSYNASLSDDNSTIHGTETTSRHAEVEIEAESILLEQVVPSLGVLDGVLHFIAAERERAKSFAVREGVASSSAVDLDDIHDAGSGDDREHVEDEAIEGEEDWRNTIENEPNHSKRRRRRKRPPRSHAAAPAVAQAANIGAPTLAPDTQPQAPEDAADNETNALAASTTSPKRKKKVKSIPASASASASSSVLSVPVAADGVQTPTTAKAKDKTFLVPPPSLSRSASKKRRDGSGISILRRPDELLTRAAVLSDDDDSDFDGGRTPTNFDVVQAEAPRGPELGIPINLTGRKGKRVGRREREREKSKHDAAGGETNLKERGDGGINHDNTFEFDDDGDDNDDDGAEMQEDEDEERGDDNDSLSNLSLLKPPRRRRERSRRRKVRDTAYIHTATGHNGSYRSIPGTPGGHLPMYQTNDGDEHPVADVGSKQSTADDDDVFGSKVNTTPEKRKRTRSKRLKPVRSVPDLKLETNIGGSDVASIPAIIIPEDRTQQAVMKATRGRVGAGSQDILDMDRNQLQNYFIAAGSSIVLMNSPPEPKNQPLPESKRGRLLSLARQLRGLFPEQYEDLGRIIQRIEKPATTQAGKAKKAVTSDSKEENDAQYNISRPKRRRSRKGGHARTGSGSGAGATSGEVFDFDEEQLDEQQGVNGGVDRAPEFDEADEDVDPRGRPPKRNDVLVHVFIDHSNILIGLLSHLKKNQNRKNAINKTRSRPLPALISKATAATRASNQTDPASAFAAVKASSARPLPIPSNGDPSTKPAPVEINSIPLPSFATVSRSLPTTSVLNTYMASRKTGGQSDDAGGKPERETNSDNYEYKTDNDEPGATGDSTSIGPTKSGKEKKTLKHLWHAALVLILERGRPVTRRVVVTSSPLYQPMETIEQLGYELRVFIRVPDFGDGQDRERYRDKDKVGSGKSNGSSKSTLSSPVTTSSSSGLALSKKTHVRHISGNTSTESGSGGGAGSGNASGSLHPYYGTPNNPAQTKVKFREQGVDELLQLKLHQALAATDTVPEGSTIVLATGDGNMGQFNEDGFLGPVRTALRRGWKVELYAWEDGLSRAWKREFGVGSDWGQRGLFRVIGMEQFADALVEVVEQTAN